jgi:hypothetical protein
MDPIARFVVGVFIVRDLVIVSFTNKASENQVEHISTNFEFGELHNSSLSD